MPVVSHEIDDILNTVNEVLMVVWDPARIAIETYMTTTSISGQSKGRDRIRMIKDFSYPTIFDIYTYKGPTQKGAYKYTS